MAGTVHEKLESIRADLVRLRGNPAVPPDASIVVPVNAQADLELVLNVVENIVSYRGAHTFELFLLVNNFPAEDPPTELKLYANAGMQVRGVPNVWRQGEALCFSARMAGIQTASSDRVISFDADSRIPNPPLLLDWYVEQFERGAAAAYTHVGHYDVRPLWSVRARLAAHHSARWFKRVMLRIPTTRGSNYAVERSILLPLYEAQMLVDDLNVGPAVKFAGGHVVYSGARRLRVLTSGRKFRGGWRKLARYLAYRLLYNARVLPVRVSKRGRSRSPYHETPLR
jgi:hypothetical protein